jgi:uncharacterized protein
LVQDHTSQTPFCTALPTVLLGEWRLNTAKCGYSPIQLQSPDMNQDLSPILDETPTPISADEVSPEEFDEIDAILDELRDRYDETPQWEFCEGFMAALICCRRDIPMDEYLEVLLAVGADESNEGSFADAAQQMRFMALWNKRWAEVAAGLDAEVKSLDDEAAYQPEVMDVRAAVAELPPQERDAVSADEIPAFAQVWALGFMFAVESWPEEWVPPRDKDAAKWLDAALQAMVALTEDDEGEPEVSPFSDDGPPTMSVARLNAFADGVWAVYDSARFGARLARA